MRFRAAKAYWITIRILAGYLWLRLWRAALGPARYQARLVERHRRVSRRLVEAILELKGLFIKVGQLISILTNFLPPEFRAELEQLQDDVPARPLDEVVARIRKELGQSPDALFAEFDPVPLASASLAQVHEARLHDGRRVAVKVQHADVEAISRLDLDVLRGILGLIQWFVQIRGMESYHADIAQMIREELDFTQEARNIATIAANFAGSTEIRFPTVVHELSTQRVLTTEFVDGVKITDFAALAAQGIDRSTLARRVLTAYCQMVFVDGVFHADPHPGNLIVQPDGGVTFVDFGAVGRLAPNVKAGIPVFWNGIIKRDVDQITAGLRQAGFISRDPALGDSDVAERAINYFQKKFLDQVAADSSFSLKDIQVDVRMKLEAMADLRKLDISFRDLSRAFQVPKEWVIFERSTLLLVGLSTQIDPDMNPFRIVGPFLQDFVLGKDADWKGQLSGAMRDMAMSAVTIPDRANRFLDRANRGDVQFRIANLPEGALLLYTAAQQIVYAFLAVALGGLAWALRGAGESRFAIAAWVGAGVCLLLLVAAILRARRIRARLGRSDGWPGEP